MIACLLQQGLKYECEDINHNYVKLDTRGLDNLQFAMPIGNANAKVILVLVWRPRWRPNTNASQYVYARIYVAVIKQNVWIAKLSIITLFFITM